MARRRGGQQITDHDVVQGGPVPPGATGDNIQQDDPPPPAPKMVKVKLGEIEIEVPEAAAGALENERQGAQQAIRAREELLTATAQRASQTPVEPKANQGSKNEDDELDELMFTNPKEYRKRLQEKIAKDMRAEYSAAETTKTFWDWFWQVNPSLKRLEHDVVAEALFTRNLPQLQSIPLRDAAVKLGSMVKDYLRTLTGTAPDPQRDEPRRPNRSTTLEGGPGPRATPTGSPPEDQPSLGDLIKARQNRIRSGGSRTQAS